jgi:membrane protein DedA with SNARE-associated domain
MLDYLLNLVARLGHWSYLVIFVAAALECAAFLGIFVPGESLMLASGFFVQQGVLELDAVILVGIAGAVLGDTIGYQLGSHFGREWLLRHGARIGLRPKRLAKAESFFTKHGPKAVFLGRFIGFARALVPFLAGASRMPYRRFLPYNALGAALWTPACVLLGYFLGSSWQAAEQWISRTSLIVGALCAMAVAATWVRRRRKRSRVA